MTEQQLADEIIEAFVRKCERLWPGCRVEVRHKQTETAPDRSRQDEKETLP